MKKRLIFGVLLLTIFALGIYARPQTDVHAESTRVVTVFIGNEEQTIATNATTVGEAIERIGLTLGEDDKTEPARNEEIKGNEFTINVYRARPITVIDGANNYTVMTAERSPRQIAEEAGFKTKQEDEFGFERSDDISEGPLGTQMVIKRAKTITFDLYGTKSKLSTNETSVAGLLEERDVKLDPGDELNVPKEARITDGMTISIAKVDKNVKTVEEPVQFPEEQIRDAQQPISYRKVKTPGKNGKKLVTYEIIRRNGGEPERRVVKEVVTVQPVKQVVVVGAKTDTFGGDFAAALAKLRSCEGGYSSWNPAGPYYGAYQFDKGTWATVADPSRYGNATPAEQDAAAHALYMRRGWSPWPVCGASLPDTYR